jgi:predicted MFS family arabinose efflux permease
VRTVRAANVVMFLVAAGLFAMFYFNTLYLQRVLGYSALEAGLAFLPFTAGIIIGAGLSQSLVPKLGAREVPLIGMPMAVVGLLLFTRLQPDGSYVTDLLPGIMLASIGMGLTFVPITLIATSGIPADDAGLASGLYNTSQQIGGALGLAILATLSVEATQDTLSGLGGAPQPADEAQALVDGFHVAYLGSAALVAGGFFALLFLLSRRYVVAVGEGEAAIGTASS